MREGLIASGAGHAVLFGWALVAGIFDDSVEPPDVQVTEVSVITSAEFAAMTSAPPTVEPQLEAPQPVVEPEPAPVVPEVQAAPRIVRPAPVPTPQPATPVPPPTVPQPVSQAEVVPEAPPAPEAPPQSDPTLEVTSKRPTPRPARRVAPEAAPAPSPEAEIAPVVQEAPKPTEAETPAEAEEVIKETAPEEAATEIVTEAETPSRAPETSNRPPRRPNRPAPAPVAEEQTSEEETAATDPLAAAIAGALEEASTTPNAPAGPPLSASETEGLRIAVQRCWNVGALSSAALATKVTIGFSLNREGVPDSGSIRLIGSEGGTADTARQAYEAGRRAIVRCGATGFDLPDEKYDHWREIEMTFNPEEMRLR